MDFRLDQAQFVVFLSAIDTAAKLKIASKAVEAIAELAQVDPLMLPLPDNAPGELPRIQIQNEEAGWGFAYSLARIDLLWNPRVECPPEQVPEVLQGLKNRAAQLWALLAEEVSARGTRLAQVVSASAAIERVAETIQAKFLAPVIAGSLAEAQVHYLRKVEIAGIKSNRWVRLLNLEGTPGRLLVQIDHNTVADQIVDVSPAIIRAFGTGASTEAAAVLGATAEEVE